MIRTIPMLSVLMAVAALLWFSVGTADAWAQTASPPPATTEKITSCAKYVGLSNRIVTCVRETLNQTTRLYFKEFYPLVQQAIGGFLTLAIIVTGILAAFGMLEKPGRDVMILLVKFAFVTFFVLNVDVMHSRLLAMMDAASGAVVEYTPISGTVGTGADLAQVECLKNMKEASGDGGYTAPWLAMDCVIDSVIGIKIPRGTLEQYSKDRKDAPTKGNAALSFNRKINDKTPGMSRGLINFFFSSMQSSVMGILLAIVGFVFIYTLVWLIAKALFVYLAAYIGIAFLMIFAPIFIPLVLFRVTKQYFDKWVKLIISFALQPVIILVFISFSIAAIDLAMFSGQYSVVYRIAGEASRQPNFNLNEYLDKNDVVKKKPAVVAEVRTGQDSLESVENRVDGLIKNISIADCSKVATDKSEEVRRKCAESFPIQKWKDDIDWKKLAELRKPEVVDPGPNKGDEATVTVADRKGRQIAREVMAAVIFAAVVVYIMNGLLGVIPAVANDLVGESFQSPNLYSQVSRASGGGLSASGGSLGKLFGAGRGG